jgi:hypothetical protein
MDTAYCCCTRKSYTSTHILTRRTDIRTAERDIGKASGTGGEDRNIGKAAGTAGELVHEVQK